MSPELQKFLLELRGHVNLAQESLTLAKAQLKLAEDKLAQVLKENQ